MEKRLSHLPSLYVINTQDEVCRSCFPSSTFDDFFLSSLQRPLWLVDSFDFLTHRDMSFPSHVPHLGFSFVVPSPVPIAIPGCASTLSRSSSSSSISSEHTVLSTTGSCISVDSADGMRLSPNAKSHTVSIGKENAQAAPSTDIPSRRTRRRFTNVQLIMLEQLYHQNSHPTREQRETLATQLDT